MNKEDPERIYHSTCPQCCNYGLHTAAPNHWACAACGAEGEITPAGELKLWRTGATP
jgi:ribosomal protein L37AE/L43A